MSRASGGRVFRIGNWILIALLCITAAATFAGKWHWILDLASHFQVYYFGAALALLVANLAARYWRGSIVLIALVGIGLFHLLPFYLPRDAAEVEGEELTAMTLNLNLGNQKTAAVKGAIADADPDILVLQEVTPRWRQELESLRGKFVHSFDLPEDGAFGIWVLSKFESLDLDVQRRGGIAFLHLRYQVAGRQLEVVAIHPPPPVNGDVAQLRDEILEATAVYASGDGPRMVIGDFNCSPWSRHFRDLIKASDLRDSAEGYGLQSTWFPLGGLAGLPLDHVLVSDQIAVTGRETSSDLGSDHRAVVVRFKLVP